MAQAPDRIPDDVVEFMTVLNDCGDAIPKIIELELYDERFTDEFIMKLRKMGERELARWALISRDTEQYVRFWASHPWGDYDGTGDVTFGQWRCSEFGTGEKKYYDNEVDLENHIDEFYTALLRREIRPILEEQSGENGCSVFVSHDFSDKFEVVVDL